MFALSQAPASRLPLLFPALLDTTLYATDRTPEVFSSPASTATNPPLAHDAPMVRPKAIEMNTCTKNRGGEGDLEIWFKAFDLPKSMGIILLHKNDEQLP
jgi:hypothetical protein